eukprot:g129.t1
MIRGTALCVSLFILSIATTTSVADTGRGVPTYKSKVAWKSESEFVVTYVLHAHASLGFQTDRNHVVTSFDHAGKLLKTGPAATSRGVAEDSKHIKIGDELLRVNGQDIRGISLEDIRILLKKISTPQPGQTRTEYDLHFRRPKKQGGAAEHIVDKKQNDAYDCHVHLFAAVGTSNHEKNERDRFSTSAVVAASLASFGLRPEGRTKELKLVRPDTSVTGCLSYSLHRDKETERGRHRRRKKEPIVVFVRRGQCSFLEKAKHALDAGASGLIVWNGDSDEVFSMQAEDSEMPVNIPVVMVADSDGSQIEKLLGSKRAVVSCVIQMGDDAMLHDPRNANRIQSMIAANPVAAPKDMLREMADAGFGDRLRVFFRGQSVANFDVMRASFSGPLAHRRRLHIFIAKGHACSDTYKRDRAVRDHAVLVPRGKCSFGQKMEVLSRAGAAAVIVYNNRGTADLIEMKSEDWRKNERNIPVVMIAKDDADRIRRMKPVSRLSVRLMSASASRTSTPQRTDAPHRRKLSTTPDEDGGVVGQTDARETMVMPSEQSFATKSPNEETSNRVNDDASVAIESVEDEIQRVEGSISIRLTRGSAVGEEEQDLSSTFVARASIFHGSRSMPSVFARDRIGIGLVNIRRHENGSCSLIRSFDVAGRIAVPNLDPPSCSQEDFLRHAERSGAIAIVLPKDSLLQNQAALLRTQVLSTAVVATSRACIDSLRKILLAFEEDAETAAKTEVMEVTVDDIADSTVARRWDMWNDIWRLWDLETWPRSKNRIDRLFRRLVKYHGKGGDEDATLRLRALEHIYKTALRRASESPSGSLHSRVKTEL